MSQRRLELYIVRSCFRSDKDTNAANLKTISRFLNRDLGPYENIAQVIKTGLAIRRLGPLTPADLKKAIKNHGRNTSV